MAIMDIIINATDNASQVIENLGNKGKEAGSKLEANWVKVGLATAAAGAGLEALARNQAPLTENTKKLAASMGMAESEVRELALATSNVTFPLDDVLSLMETGRQRGLEGAAALQEYATFWDTVGDATGESATALGEAGSALAAVGIAAGNEKEALAAFGYIAQETTSDVGEFIAFIDKTGPSLREMGMDINDSAAVLGILEKEFGMSGKVARTEFNAAVKEADGDMKVMLDTLGISSSQFSDYSSKVAESSDVIQRNADIHGESYTIMQKLQHSASELTYKYGDLVGVVGDFSPLLMAVGPMMKGLTVAKGAWAAVTSGTLLPALTGAIASVWSFTAALLANPITWIVIGIMALIAAIVLLWKNWDKVSAFLVNTWGKVKEGLSKVWEWAKEFFGEWGPTILAVLMPFIGIPLLIYQNWDAIKEWFSNLWERVKEIFANGWEKIKEVFMKYTAIGMIITHWDTIKEWFANLWESIREGVSAGWEKIKSLFLQYTPLGLIITHWDAITDWFADLWESIKTGISTGWEKIKTAFLNYTPLGLIITHWESIKDWFKNLWDAIKKGITIAWDGIKTAFLNYTPVGLIYTHWETITSWFGTLWENVKTTISGKIEAIRTQVISRLNSIRDFASTVWNGIRDRLTEVWENVRTAVVERLSALYTSVTGQLQRIWDWIIDIPKRAITWGRNIIIGLANGIMSMGPAIWNAIKRAAGGAFTKFLRWVGIKSYSRMFAGYGKYIPEGLAVGITRASGLITKANKKMLESTRINKKDLYPDDDFGSHSFPPPDISALGVGKRNSSNQIIKHEFDTLRIEGVNDEGQIIAVKDILVKELYRGVRGGPA